MKNLFNFNIKSIVLGKARWLLTFIAILTLGVGQMWANYAYLDLSGTSWWYNDGAAFRLDKNGTGNVDSYTEISGTGVWRFDIGSYTGSATFKRMNSGRTDQWNYANVSISSSQNVFHTEDNNGVTTRTTFVINYIHGTNYVYFDNSVSNFTNNIYFVIGHDYSPTGSSNTYSKAYKMTQLTGTTLYYVSVTDTWPDATYYAIIADDASSISATAWGSSSLGTADKGDKGYTAAYKTNTYNMEGGTYLLTTAASGNGKALTIAYYDGYSNIPTNTMGINVRTKVAGGSYGSSYNSPTTVNVQTRYLNGNGSSNTQSASVSTSAKTASKADVTTGAVTYSYTALADNAQWQFDGWGTSNSTVASTNPTYSITAGSAASKTNTTIYAFFTRKPLLTVNKGSNGSSATGTAANNAKTSWTLSASPNTGYHFANWTVGSGSVSFDDNESASATATISADATITANFAPNEWTVSLDFDGGSGVSATTSVDVTYDATTNLTSAITAPSFSGYTFDGYWTGKGGTGSKLIDANGYWIKSVAGYTGASSSNPTWKYNDNLTLYAKWTQHVSLHKNNVVATSAVGGIDVIYHSSSVSGFSAATRPGYSCTGYFTTTSGGYEVITSDGALKEYNTNIADYIGTDGKWKHNTATTLYAYWEANEYTISFNHNSTGLVGAPATNIQANVTVTYDDDNFSAATVGIPVLAGYTFGGYYTDVACSAYQIVDAEGNWTNSKSGYLDGSGNWIKNANTPLYAKWTPKNYTVTFDAGTNGGYIDGTTGDKPNTTSTVAMGQNYNAGTGSEVGAFPTAYRSGYVFDGWYTLPSGGTKVLGTTQMTTANNHTLYAHFNQRNYVYFYNNLNWENVYVTYSAYWDTYSDKGTGNNGCVYHQMTRIGETNVYRDEIPAAIVASWTGTNAWIAFDNTGFSATDGVGTYNNFTSGKVIHRRDFDSYATMFVPNSAASKDFTKNGSADYYCTGLTADKQDEVDKDYRYIDKGYWTRYDDTHSGYVIKGSWDADHDYYFRRLYSDHLDTSTVTLRLSASTNYTFKLYKHCTTDNYNNSWFSKSASPYTITSDACTNVVFNSRYAGHYNAGDQNVTLTTTQAGDYTFKLICDKTGVLKLTVVYPPAPTARDYRLVYTWNDGSAHTRVSEMKLIPNLAIRNIDMFVHKPSGITSSSLKLQKYNGSAWADAYTYTLSDELIPANGVYTFKIEGRDSDPICSAPERYNGAYYLRSDVTGGGWEYYRTATFGDNTMTYSAYSLTQTLSAPYSHYYCIWVNNTSTSVAYTIATENSPSICDTLTTDAIVTGSSCHLPAKANVRFGWNEQTNALVRSYLKSAVEDNSRFLVLHGKADNMIFKSNGDAIPAAGDLEKNELQFEDKGDWVYEIALQAKPGAKACLIAKYGDTDRYLIGDGSTNWMDVLAGKGSDQYPLKGVYDFKTNRLMIAWTPGEGTINDELSDFDMLWIRHAQSSANQINLGPSGSLTNVSVVAALEFRYNELIGQVSDWTSDSRPLMKFFVSFPFDVNVSDIFGLNGAEYGREYVVQKYNGAKRAEKGLYTMDPGFWEDLTVDSVMHKHEGYCIIMDNDYLNNASASIWEHKSAGSSIYMYLPATSKINITGGEPTSTVYPHVGKDKEFGSGKNHNQTDSHWNMIGSPLFHDSYIKSSTNAESVSLPAYYTWNSSDNSWSAETTYARDHAYPAMSSFLVQWYGTITWSTVSSDPTPVAARRNNEPTGNYLAQIDLMYNGEAVDWAFVHMRDGASEDHVLCEELNKMTNSGKSNIYVFAGNYEVAYNQVPIANQTIPVGLIIKKNGNYTFSMPTNFSGTVTLIDTFAQTRTNLAFEDYEVTLQKGTINDRFFLEFDITNAPTAIDGAMGEGEGSLKDGKAHKFIQNGTMYILRDGVIYDAQGKKVE